MASRAERVPAVQRVDPALAQLGLRVPLRLRRQPQHSAFAYLISFFLRNELDQSRRCLGADAHDPIDNQ
jgi:hypothetical protein